MKIVLLCHFSNSIIRGCLPLDNLRLDHFIYDTIRKKRIEYHDFANWVTNIISYLETCSEIETHVISPHYGLTKSIYEFQHNNIQYHFYRSMPLFPWNLVDRKLNPTEYVSFNRNRKKIKAFMDEIKPDLINLIGAENPYYSIAALDYNEIPILLHCQTVYSNPQRLQLTGVVNTNIWETEQKLFKHINYYACSGDLYYRLIKEYNEEAIIFPRTWPSPLFPLVPEIKKEYTFSYFARLLNINKGFDNALKAFAKVRRIHPEVTMLAVGSFEPKSEKIIKNLIRDLELEGSISIHNSFPEYVDMLKYIKRGKFAVLPIKMDIISGTIYEAMRLGMPVVTHITSGTTKINEERQTILLSAIGDIDALADNMCKLVESEDLALAMRNNGLLYMKKLDEKNENNGHTMVKQYKAVYDNYYKNVPIPKELLFNSDK